MYARLARAPAAPVPVQALPGLHVATTGNDSTGTGSLAAPWLTLQKAADSAAAGDTVYIHAGTYREQLDPPTGGTNAATRITFTAYPGDEGSVFWKGSERITSWSDEGGGIWSCALADAGFNGFNPYTEVISGSYLSYGGGYHRGGVFLEGAPYVEVLAEGSLTAEGRWWTSHSGSTTTIKAHFGANDPNALLAEVTYRKAAVWPTKTTAPGIDYLTLSWIRFAHFATNWSNPEGAEAPQEGALFPNGGKGWLIERCWITDSKNVGISVGLWVTDVEDDVDTGHHTIRYCTIERCGQAGIAGSHGMFAGTIERCLIQDIGAGDLWGGFEPSGIKLHSAIDIVIRNNVIRRIDEGINPKFGLWLDWQAQNTRVSGNVIYDVAAPTIWLEANHGPLLIDNNVLVDESGGASVEIGGLTSRGTAACHNLVVHSHWTGGPGDGRSPNWFTPHTSTPAGSGTISPGGCQHWGNIHVDANMGALAPCDYNVIWNGSAAPGEDANSVAETYDPGVTLTDLANGVTVEFTSNGTPASITVPSITTAYLGADNHGIELDNPDDSALTVSTDILGNARGGSSRPGPLQGIASGANSFTLYAGADAP